MLRRLAVALVLVAAAAPLPAQVAASGPQAAAPLIARETLFGNPSRVGGAISPDGRWLSWIAPRDGVLNVWVAPAASPSAARPLTAETKHPIRITLWSPDSKSVLYLNDKDGDENFLLYGVDVASGAAKAYTPFQKTRVEIVGTSRRIKDRILVGVNNRDARWHDVYSLELPGGKLTLVHRNDGDVSYFVDEDLVLRVAVRSREDGGADYYRLVDGRAEDKPFVQVGLGDSLTTSPLQFSADGKTLYWGDSRDRDTDALVAQDVASGRFDVLAQDARADIGDALFDPRTGRPQAYLRNYLASEYVALDPAVQDDLAYLKNAARGRYAVVSRTDDDATWLVDVDRVTEPASTWIYERKSRRLTQLYVSRPELQGAPLVPMRALELKARDGLTLVSYLSLPPGVDFVDGKASRPAAMVLLVHGGPWTRDEFGFNRYHQWLANRGYAVLSVNYRGSTGFGKSFVSAGDLQWGRKMQEDLLDAVDWAVRSGVTRRDQVAIAGSSYGGYATLAGMTFTPTTFACGVDIVGPSNLFTLLEAIPPYWQAIREQFYKRTGDPRTDAGRALLKERSPLTFADRIARPLLIGQGANDPRVNVRESDQIVAAAKARGIPVTYVIFRDEGHGFARPANSIAFNAMEESFLQHCLGGRAEPFGKALQASTAEVRNGAQFVPGLREALGAH
jgi:dipeptidyl aminopeptidase/acylaminoacyl peptidase